MIFSIFFPPILRFSILAIFLILHTYYTIITTSVLVYISKKTDKSHYYYEQFHTIYGEFEKILKASQLRGSHTVWNLAIGMSHLRHTMVDGAKFRIRYQRLAFLSSFGRWQLIQNLAPSTMVWRQYDIQIWGIMHNLSKDILDLQLKETMSVFMHHYYLIHLMQNPILNLHKTNSQIRICRFKIGCSIIWWTRYLSIYLAKSFSP